MYRGRVLAKRERERRRRTLTYSAAVSCRRCSHAAVDFAVFVVTPRVVVLLLCACCRTVVAYVFWHAGVITHHSSLITITTIARLETTGLLQPCRGPRGATPAEPGMAAAHPQPARELLADKPRRAPQLPRGGWHPQGTQAPRWFYLVDWWVGRRGGLAPWRRFGACCVEVEDLQREKLDCQITRLYRCMVVFHR